LGQQRLCGYDLGWNLGERLVNNSHKNAILNSLDLPLRILIFTCDQVGGFLGVFLIFTMAFDLPEFGIVFGTLTLFLLPSLKKKLGAQSFKRILYWFLPTHESSIPYPIPSYMRELIG
jgi:hypothetical protein